MAYHHISSVALVVKNPPASDRDVKDMGSIPESGRFSGGGHGNPLQCSFMETPTDRGAWWATVHRVAKSQTRLKQLSTHACLSSGRNPTLIIWLTQKILAVFNGETIKTVVQVKLLLNPSRENPQTELNRKRVVSCFRHSWIQVFQREAVKALLY